MFSFVKNTVTSKIIETFLKAKIFLEISKESTYEKPDLYSTVHAYLKLH